MIALASKIQEGRPGRTNPGAKLGTHRAGLARQNDGGQTMTVNSSGQAGKKLPLADEREYAEKFSAVIEDLNMARLARATGRSLAAWEKQIEPTRPPAPRPSPAGASAPASAAPKSGKLNVVEYLGSKGVKVTREGDGYRVGRELETKASTLTIVNRYRRAAELPVLGLLEIE